METQLGRFTAEVERPEPIKFAWPILILPELFTTAAHLAILRGYLATIGWEVYAPDLRAAAGRAPTPALGRLGFADLVALAREALSALKRDAIVLGHGMGGLVALKLAAYPGVKAAVAFAPAIPGFARTPLLNGVRAWLATRLGRPLGPPRGRVLFEFVADAEPFQRPKLIEAMVPDTGLAACEVARGQAEAASATRGESPAARMVVVGDSDPFAPLDRVRPLVATLGGELRTIPGRGHWLIGGRALERAVNEAHRFLVRSLGQDLLLLYPEEWKNEGNGEET